MPRLTVDSPVGSLTLVSDEGALTVLDWGSVPAEGADPVLDRAADQLVEWFAGRRQDFDLPLRPAGTVFQQRVWAALLGIPFGATVRYGALARQLGTAARAIGGACGRNPLPIIIPCHRVLGGSGPGGYSGFGGVQTKNWLLKFEGTPHGASLHGASPLGIVEPWP